MAPRRAALEILSAVRRGATFDAALNQGLRPLEDRDSRLAHELAAGVLRHATSLDGQIAAHVPRGIDSISRATLDILRLGAYQLRYLDRVPAHAAVATAVDLTREAGGKNTSGFVNAVLRKISALGPAGATASDESLHLADLWSHPRWLVARWVERFGLEESEALMSWNNSHPPLVLQAARDDLQSLRDTMTSAAVQNFPAPWEAGLVVDATRPEKLPGFRQGTFYVQDTAQALVLRFADFPESAAVFDACAAPGGKTLGLSRGGRMVIAADQSRRRIKRLRENLERAGTGREYPVVADAHYPPIRPVMAYLLDAPCLGTGTFARHPDARLRVTLEALHRLAADQATLLDAAAERVASGGVLCYATCSLEPEEDEDQVTAFLVRHPEFRREAPADFPSELLTPAGDLQLLPQQHGTDGAYAARLVRS